MTEDRVSNTGFRKAWLATQRRKLRLLLDRLFDRYYGIDTVTDSVTYSSQSTALRDHNVNGPVSYWLLHKYLNRRQFKPSSDVFIDVGCGHGRVLCYVARCEVLKAIGYEISPEFSERAKANATRLHGKKSVIEVHTGDAIHANYVDGTIYFFGDPFGHETMKQVLSRIGETLATRPRKVCCIFWLPRYVDSRVEDVIESSGWLSHQETRKAFYSPMRAEYWVYDPESQEHSSNRGIYTDLMSVSS